ncbi:MAG: UV damage repair endonuclease UvsE [Flavobacteriales bacterium]|jgi:UV DNA damage endonuclease|nr:UV damage repair endonuclease UvsE [Flavobacteriales bacterium]
MNLGYACINTALSANKIMTNRTMRRKTFEAKGLDYVSDLALLNVKDLKTIVQWNNEMGIKLFRLSSQIFPWSDDYKLSELKDYNEICDIMLEIGKIATDAGQRLTMHPGPYNCLASPNQKVVEKTIRELNCHSEQFNMLGFEPSNYNKINIHVGGAYGDKKSTLERFCKNFQLLREDTKKRLVIENDDSPNEFSVKELFDGIYQTIGIPITFDYFHHTFNTGGLTEEQALKLAAITWPEGITQCCHYSESRRKEKLDESIRPQAHSDIIYNKINTYGLSPDIVIEAKLKEQSIFSYAE